MSPRIAIIVAVAVSAVGLDIFAKTRELRYDQSIVSPNGRFTVTYAGIIQLKNSQTGESYPAVSVMVPVISLEWTGDSTSIVCVQHIAGGSTASIIHFDGTGWRRFDADPPGEDYDRYGVIKTAVGEHSIRLTYRAQLRKNAHFAYYTCAFNVDPTTGAQSQVVIRQVNEHIYNGLRDVDERGQVERKSK